MKMQGLALRFLISLGVGLVVSAIAVVASWIEYGADWHLRFAQDMTQGQIVEIDKAIVAYRAKTGGLPKSLAQLREMQDFDFCFGFEEDGTVNDSWWKPFLFLREGEKYTVLSYGRDGKPGGRGLDCDLTNHNLRPPGWFPTFRQFLFEMPSQRMVLACVIGGFLAFLTSLFTVRAPDLSRHRLLPLAIKLGITIIAATIVAVFMSALEIPTGH